MWFLFFQRPLKNASDGTLMDDNQNEWGDEETLDTKKFRVSSLPRSVAVQHVVTGGVLSWKEQSAAGSSRAEGPPGARSALRIAAAGSFANLRATVAPLGLAELPTLELSPLLPPCLVRFARCSFPAVVPSSRSRRCCPTRTIRRITGSGPSSTWMPLTCAYPPWRLLRRRGKSMRTAWMSTSEGPVRWTPFTSVVLVSSSEILPYPLQVSGPRQPYPSPFLAGSCC